MIWVRTLTLVFAIGVLRAADPVTPVNQNGQGIAVKGTDVVAYFTGGSPKTGQSGALPSMDGRHVALLLT